MTNNRANGEYILEILENGANCRYFETIDTVSGSK